MDGFGDAFGSNDTDPAAEFLAREQNDLAGLEDDLPPVVTNGVADKNSLPTAENELDAGFEMISHGNSTSENMASAMNGEESNGLFDDVGESVISSTPAPQAVVREEPEKIRRWREEQKTRLEEKDAHEETKKSEMREAAKKELEEWYKAHEDQIEKNRTTNRSAEKDLVAANEPMQPGTEWERIAKLCDFSPKGSKHQKDISRMRSIILQLKQSPPMKRE